MRQLIFRIIICSSIFSCSDDDGPIGFSQAELSPVVTFTQNNKPVMISQSNSGLWTNSRTLDEKGEEVSTKGFGSVIDSSENGQRVTIVISKWVSADEKYNK